MNKVIIVVVVLAGVIWLAPEKPYKVLNALYEIVQAAGPNALKKDASAEETPLLEDLISKAKGLL
jgi:hypothetical protein